MRTTLLRIALVLLLTSSLRAENGPSDAVQRFREALKSVDRVLLIPGGFESNEAKKKGPLLEIKGAEVIGTLADTIEIEKFDQPCLCLTSPEIHFYCGDSYRFLMTLHHGYRLRCEDGPWGGDAVMTDKSAARFRAWFEQHGYSGFVRGFEMAEQWRREQSDREKKFLTHFPEATRGLFPEKKWEFSREEIRKRADQLAAGFPNRKELVLACWRGLGELQSWDGQAREAYDWFVAEVLAVADEPTIREALQALLKDDSQAWLGAYVHYKLNIRKPSAPITKLVNDEWLARLAGRSLRDGPVDERMWIIRTLGEHPGKATDQLLLDIAKTTEPANASSDPPSPYFCDPAVLALFELARLHKAEAKPLIVQRLTIAKDEIEKPVLEVALALFEGPARIRPEHLNSEIFNVAEEAWRILSTAPDFAPSIDFLLFAAGSDCYKARQDADALLRKRGVRPLSKEERVDEAMRELHLDDAITLPELDRLIGESEKALSANPRAEIEGSKFQRLRHQRGLIYLRSGDLTKARDDLKAAGRDAGALSELAYVLQTLGRFDDAGLNQRMGFSEDNVGKPAADYLERRGFLGIAEGRFESAAKDFAASLRLNLVPEESRLIFRHLALALAGKDTGTDITEWESFIGISDAELYWPQTGVRLLQGKMTEAEVFRRIEQSRYEHDDNLCEAHFVLSVLCRIKTDPAGEKPHLLAAIATKAFTNQCWSLATIRLRQLEEKATAKP